MSAPGGPPTSRFWLRERALTPMAGGAGCPFGASTPENVADPPRFLGVCTFLLPFIKPIVLHPTCANCRTEDENDDPTVHRGRPRVAGCPYREGGPERRSDPTPCPAGLCSRARSDHRVQAQAQGEAQEHITDPKTAESRDSDLPTSCPRLPTVQSRSTRFQRGN